VFKGDVFDAEKALYADIELMTEETLVLVYRLLQRRGLESVTCTL
jgi:hypothetical protein